MSEQVQELIQKIKSEGIEAAESEASQIKAQAQKQVQTMIADAKEEAQKLINEANAMIKRKAESAQKTLKQASRDAILSLRQQIESVLKNIVAHQVSDSLTAENLSTILEAMIKAAIDQNVAKDSVGVQLNPSDAKKLKDSFASKLQGKLKEGIAFQSSSDINKGFVVSFDQGKSGFDFTEESLTNYLSTFLNAELAGLLKGSD